MTDSSFDPEAFLGETINDSFSTKFPTVPEGNYTSIIDKIAVKEVVTERGRVPVLEVFHNLLEDQLKADLGMEKIVVRQSIFLDLDGAGKLDVSEYKNVRLGRLRDAVGQNVPGEPWGYRMLEGAGPLLIAVIEKPDKNDPETKYNEVSRTAPLAA